MMEEMGKCCNNFQFIIGLLNGYQLVCTSKVLKISQNPLETSANMWDSLLKTLRHGAFNSKIWVKIG